MTFVDCSNDGYYVANHCNDCNSVLRYHLDCKRRVCYNCNQKRSGKLQRKYKRIGRSLLQGNTFFVTLTLRNTMEVGYGVKKIRKAFKRLISDRNLSFPYFRWFSGGLYAIECDYNNDSDSFNVHIHACIDSYIDISRIRGKTELNKDWYTCTGDSYITDWQPTRHKSNVIGYCLKYTTKQVDYGERVFEVENSLKGTRMLSFFGIFYNYKGMDFKKEYLCPNCGSDHINYLCTGVMDGPIVHTFSVNDLEVFGNG